MQIEQAQTAAPAAQTAKKRPAAPTKSSKQATKE
jgi:hypothetical protein